MTDLLRLDDDILVAGQLERADLEQAAAQGAVRVICNRPDAEEPGQPEAAEVARWAEEHGLEFVHVPMISGQLSLDAVAAMGRAMESAEGPVLAYCRSGTRSAALWALASVSTGKYDPDTVLEKARATGYDLRGLVPTLRQLVQRRSD